MVSHIKYLGFLLDSSLNFKDHVKAITSEAYGALKTLRQVQVSLPLSSWKLLYRSLSLPLLEIALQFGIPALLNLSIK